MKLASGHDWKLRAAPLLPVALLMAGCSVQPVALESAERDSIAAESRERLFVGQEPITAPLSLYDATARAMKYQAEVRVRLMEQAAALGQLDVAQFDLLPKLTANAGYSTRSNEAFGFGFSPNGTVATNPSASVERTRQTATLGFTWNVLDFGLSYYRAQQLADQSLIAEERRRKALQNLVQDVRLAWWRADAAQRLLPLIDALYEEVDQTIEKTRVIESRKLLPPLQTASLRRALLDMKQQVSVRRQELEQAKLELAALVNAPPGTDVRTAGAARLATPPDLATRVDALEVMALRNRPELAEEAYKARIGESEAKKAFLALFPNFNLDLAGNYDSNRFLVNNTWSSLGLGVAFNLVRAFSRPSVERSAEAQRQVDEARRLAVAMTIMTQTRMATVRYGLLAQELGVWDEAATDDEQIVKFIGASAEVGIDNELELVRAKARHLISMITRDLVYANVEAALGRIYNSVGLDVLPDRIESHDTAELARQLQSRMDEWQKNNFSARPAPESVTVAIGEIIGVPEAAQKEFRAALMRILELSRLNVVTGTEAGLRVLPTVNVEPLRSGGRPVVMRVLLLDGKTGAVRFSSELKTTLSEPIDPEQWRTLGEGAAYRVAGPLLRMQASRPPPDRRSAEPTPVAEALPVISENRIVPVHLPGPVRPEPVQAQQALSEHAEPDKRVPEQASPEQPLAGRAVPAKGALVLQLDFKLSPVMETVSQAESFNASKVH